MKQPGRKYNSGSKYRYGFNGKENDNEVKGDGDQQDYGMRISDSRLGRFLSVDPLSKTFPFYTPYQFAGNTPVQAIDLDGEEPFYMADRGFSIKWYYQTFNPINQVQRNPFQGTLLYSMIGRNKFGPDAIDRLRAFATENHNQYYIHKQTGVDNKVYHNSKKLGYYDCVTSQEASLQVLKNDYSIKLKDGGNAELSGQKWEKEGLVGTAMTFIASGVKGKNTGDVTTINDLKTNLPIAENLENDAGRTLGTTFFTFEIGKDFHGGIAGVTTNLNDKGQLISTFFLADQQRGFIEFKTAEEFNANFQNYLFLNSTNENKETKQRYYNPGNGGKNISKGNEKVVFRKVKK